MSNYNKLQAVLTEVFQLDQADLDFGIYRIMNQKRDAINDFLQNSLPKKVKELLEKNLSGDAKGLKEELDKTIAQATALGADPNSLPKVKELKDKIAASASIETLEQEVFSHLANFFKRYYQGGDFISLRRYKKDVYAIPYEGEEVKLHWANHDQYYIKTSEYLKNYAFKLGGDKLVKFQLKEASTEQNNNKTQNDQERRFAIFEELPIEFDSNTLLINFTYEPHKKSVKQDDLTKKAIEVIKQNVSVDFADIFALAPTESNKQRTLLDKHLNSFVARHTFDYFIHKDLGGFLRRELDFYIKNEVLYIDDINTENEIAFNSQISKIKALKQVANKIILFLEQLENFQKKLWLKKKFVIASNYCITIDRIPEDYYSEILENKAQLEEWETLYGVNVKTLKDLENEPFLVLDTKFFSEDFKDRMLAEFDDLDEQTNGLLINSENFQALNFLQDKYNAKILSLYTDPPYNTSASEIIYKNSYKHSSWNSFMLDRIELSRNLLKQNGISCYTIDDLEFHRLKELLLNIYGFENYLATTPIRNNPSGRSTVKGFSVNHEYAIYFSKSETLDTVGRLEHSSSQLDRYSEKDDIGFYEWENLRRNGPDSNKEDRPKQYYPIIIDPGTLEISLPELEWNELDKTWKILSKIDDKKIICYPIHPDGTHKVWRYSIENIINEPKRFKAIYKDGLIEFYRKKYVNTEGVLPRTWWDSAKYSARDNGTRTIVDIFNSQKVFDFPKAVEAVMDALKITKLKNNEIALDYFAGSGTTGHAIIKLNREDQGNRKYILVEMGTYFNTVTKPRIQKVIYSDNWKNGKPQDKKGISQIFKYMVLESYEDALNNLTLQQTQPQQGALEFNDKVREEYLLQYMLDVESQEHLFNLDAFKNPFNYKLNVTENNELIQTKVDLVETFNYLIGLKVQKVERIKEFKLVTGENLKGDKMLVIWRNLEKTNNDDLNRFVEKLDIKVFDGEFDIIYVNGDNNLSNFKKEEESWKVRLIEEEFFNKMFEQI
jgi:adenine-specific DNA-methyltransferase